MQVSFRIAAVFIALTTHLAAASDGDALRDELRAVAERAVAFPGTPGLSIAVALGDDIFLAEGFGFADIENEIAVTPETVFRIGSVTKQFTAAAILTLIEDGEISFNDDLTKHYAFDTQGKSVTMHQLLNHTSGIPSYTDLGGAWQKTVRSDLSHEEMLGLVEGRPFDFEPGESWHYNNTGYYLLGAIIEDTTADPLDDYLSDRFFEPLGMESTRVGSHLDIIPHRARGYAVQGAVLKNADFISMNQPGGAGALLSTASDLVRWTRGLAAGEVLSEESYQKMITPEVLPDGKETGYGYGLMIGDFEGTKRIGHGGGIHGFVSQLSYYPEQEITVVVLANSTAQPVAPIESTLARLVLASMRVAAAGGETGSG